jgi:hypothetical protein
MKASTRGQQYVNVPVLSVLHTGGLFDIWVWVSPRPLWGPAKPRSGPATLAGKRVHGVGEPRPAAACPNCWMNTRTQVKRTQMDNPDVY